MTTKSHEGHGAAAVQDRHLPARSVALTQVTEWAEGAVRPVEDFLAAEEPLEIRVGGKALTVTMRTPGNDRELAAGLLFTEGLLERREQLREIREANRNVVEIETGALGDDEELPERNFMASAACGVCGKASIEAVHRRDLKPPDSAFTIDPELVCTLPERLRGEQEVFVRTGGLHAAALFDMSIGKGGTLLALREDIGRHNAVDKVVGWALLEGRLPLSNHVLLVSGRGGFEIVQKALAAGVPVLASVSAPSSLAVRLAREFNLTMVGFLRGRRFVVYSGAARCIPGAR